MLHEPAAQRWWLLQRPIRVLEARSISDVLPLLRQVQDDVERHQLFAAGYLAYEAAAAFDPAFCTHPEPAFPLAWFGLYEKPRAIPNPAPPMAPAAALRWKLSIARPEYEDAIGKIKNYIRAGDTYQVNYTCRLRTPFAGNPMSLFSGMVQAQGAHCSAFLNTGRFVVCCASPELFFRLDGNEITCRPMKGTAPRGLWPAQDQQRASELQHSEKNRAENVMIVDMVRNDLGRIAQSGSVRVNDLFALERYPTLWQLTSTVQAATTASVPKIFQALFPAASITGAPKIRTMQIIAELEKSPRHIYTGAIGFIAPGRQAQFNVAIRTVLVDTLKGQAEYGIGGGIVWDSEPAHEFEECKTKARIITNPMPDFALLETILWSPAEGYTFLDAHLRRLSESAAYFSRPIFPEEIRHQLNQLAQQLTSAEHRVRLLLHRDGKLSLEPHLLQPLPQSYKIALAEKPIVSHDPFLYHKTTHRMIYEQALAGLPGADDVLLWNEDGEVTESTIANVVVKKQGRLLTPPISSGLLPGIYRAHLLAQKKITEAPIRVADLVHYSKIYLCNSVRGIWEVFHL